MFVVLAYFIFFLNLSVCRTTETKDLPFKDQLKKSLTHLKDMLFAIEGKIKQEKEKLSQINYNLNHEENPPAARSLDKDLTPTNPHDYAMEMTSATAAAAFTFATMFPSPPDDTHWLPTEIPDTTVITNFPVFSEPTEPATTTLTPFVQDMERVMKEDKHNYFTAFLSRLMELIAIKDSVDTIPVLNKLIKTVTEKLEIIMFDEEMGQRLLATLKDFTPIILSMEPDNLKEQAMFAHFTIKNKATEMSPYYQNMTDFYGNFFNNEEGENLFKALEAFYEYNTGRHTAEEVSDMIASAALAPYIRVKKTRTTTSALNETTESAVNVSEFSVHVTESAAHETESPLNVTEHLSKSPGPVQGVPQYRRRNINFHKKNKHDQLKHPKFLDTMKQQYKNVNKSKTHQHRALKRKLDEKYRNNRDGYLNKREKSRQAYISSQEVYNQPKSFQVTVTDHMRHMIRPLKNYN